jgi:hypothetical protein
MGLQAAFGGYQEVRSWASVIRCDQGEWKRIGMIESLGKVSDPQLGSNSIKSSHQKILARLVRKLHGTRGYGSNFCTPIGWSILVNAKIRRTSVVSQIFNFDKKKCSEAAKMRNDVVDLWHRRTAEEAVYAILVLIDSAVLGRPWSMLDIRNMTR